MPIGKVVLVYPAMRRYSGYLSAQRVPGQVCTHAGLSILKRVLERDGYEALAYDEQITPFGADLVDGADLVGVSIQTCNAVQGYRIADSVRRLGIPVVLGGAHATLNPDEALEHADYVVRGEGEVTLSELCRALRSPNRDAELRQIQGLSFCQHGVATSNPSRPLMTTAELDRIPWPEVGSIEGASSLRYPLNRSIYFTMATRGCDQACNYCSITKVFGQTLRHRSIGSMIEELGARWDPERQFLFFMDDSLATGRTFLKELLSALLENRLVPKLGWHSQMRIDVADDPELVELMGRTNCTFVSCGFESPRDRALRSLSKGQCVADIERGVARLRERGILVNGFFVTGTDQDRPEDVAETVRFAHRIGCTLAGFMPLTPYPGTPMWKKLEREGRIFTRDWELYDMQHVVIRPANMSPLELYLRTLACYPAFYAGQSPWKQLRRLLPHWPAPVLGALALAWPVARQWSWSREVVANLDYIHALRRLDQRPQRAFPRLSEQGLWAKDLWSGRAIKRRIGSRPDAIRASGAFGFRARRPAACPARSRSDVLPEARSSRS